VRTLTTSLAIAAFLLGCGGDGGEPSADPAAPGGAAEEVAGFDSDRAFADLEAQVAIGPRPAGSAANRETAELIAERLREAGVEQVGIQRPWRNVVGVIPGDEPDAILLGAHFDTKDGVAAGFEGANDGASGVAVVLELARALAHGAPLEGPSVHLALFDAEEARGARPFELDGARGSRQYVEVAAGRGAAGVPPLRTLGAMILFDMVGDCDLEIPREAASDPDLYEYIAISARAVDGSEAPFEGTTGAINDDHVPFLEAGVPAVDLIDFEYGPDNSYWHTAEDTLDKVCAESLDAVGEAVLRILPAPTG
jgi:Zn-dependent M28 family amino/carboxypeptidase